VSLFSLTREPLDVVPSSVAVEVRPQPRLPLLPRASAFDGDEERTLRDAEAYATGELVTAWVGFEASFGELEHWILERATTFARLLAEAEPLHVQLTTAGTHPRVGKPFVFNDDLLAKRFALARKHLANEGALELSPRLKVDFESERGVRGFVRVAHEPNGPTLFTPEMREALGAATAMKKPVPVTLEVCLPRFLASSAELDALLDAAASRPDCIGGFVAQTDLSYAGSLAPYERLAQTTHRDSVEQLKRRVRSPGWRVIVPREAVPNVRREPSVEVIEVAAGLLLRSRAADPFTMTDAERESVERVLLGCIGGA
jgi:hypothetical protein